jgi:uncharacterized protein (TIGR03437 family)
VDVAPNYGKLGCMLHVMRATPVLLFLAPCVIAANQPTFSYAVPANTTVTAMAVDAAGNTYLTGSTSLTSFPATSGALQTQFSGGACEVLPAFMGVPLMLPCTDAFVIKLGPAGNILFATYFGGNGNQTVASAICVDASGNVYLGGTTGANTVSQPDTFPVTAGAAFTSYAGGFAAKLNSSGSALVYSTLLPANPVALAIDPAGEVYVASTSAGAVAFPTTPGAFQSTPPFPNGSGVVVKLNASGSALIYATYLSGSGLTVPQGIAIDAAGDVFVAGYTQAADFPVTPGAFQTAYFAGAEYMEFVTKLNPRGTGLVYSTFLGATLKAASAVKVDAKGGAYVLATGGVELSSGGYLSHLSVDGSSLVYSTYVLSLTTGLGLDLDSAGSAFVIGVAGNTVLATSPGAFQSGLAGNTGSDLFAAKFTSNGQLAGATYASVAPAAGGEPLIAVAPSGAIMLAEGNPDMTVISIFPWLTAQNAASGVAGTVAPGEIVTLRGYGIGPATAVASGQTPVDQVGGTQVAFGGVAAPVFSAQSQQIAVQVPWEIAGQTSAEVVVIYNGGPPAGTSSSAPVVVATAAPGIYAVANSDGTLNSTSNPAKTGSFITLYGTGGGVTSPLGITGGLWSITESLPTLASPVSVTIGGTNAMVLYAGSAPTLESGYFQMNVALPSGLQASSAVNLVLAIGASSMATVPISIQ